MMGQEDDPFLLGFGNFSGAMSLNFGRVVLKTHSVFSCHTLPKGLKDSPFPGPFVAYV